MKNRLLIKIYSIIERMDVFMATELVLCIKISHYLFFVHGNKPTTNSSNMLALLNLELIYLLYMQFRRINKRVLKGK